MMLPPVEPAVPYDAIRPQLGTGDLFFLHTCSTQGMWIERIEQSFGLAPLSHVGMVIKDDHEDEKLFLWDAPGGGDCFADPYVADTDNRLNGSSEEHPGCRVSVLDHVLAYYSTKVDVRAFWVRRLTQPASPQQFGALREFVNRVDGLPFPIEHGYLGLAENFAAGQNRKTLLFGTYFCSQLVAASYMHMGMLEMDARPPNAYAPAHFGIDTTDFGLTDPPPLVPPGLLGDVVFVRWDRPPGHGSECQQEAW